MILLLVACGGGTPVCEGGGNPSISVGLEDGDAVPIDVDAGGAYRFVWEAEATGVDTTTDVTALYRVRFGDEASNDYTARVTLLCEEPGPALHTAITPLPEEYQAAAAAQALDGTAMTLIVAYTNPDGAGPQGTFSLTVDAYANP